MFRSLQSSPATISIFHNPKLAVSTSLYHLLQNKMNKINSSKKSDQFIIDLMENKMPTFDQYKLLIGMNSAKVKSCYPLLSDRVDLSEKTIIKGTPNLFNQGEYNLIYETFNELIDHPDKSINPVDIFKAPLVVDWDQSKVAIDETDLHELLSVYKVD